MQVGDKYGRLTIIELLKGKSGRSGKAVCSCVCGKTTAVFKNNLKRGNTRSCGCLWEEEKKKGKHGAAIGGKVTREYRSWVMMKNRCLNPKSSVYGYYGGRGITIDNSWIGSFKCFLKDMGERPIDHSLDRVDNSGNYCKENCKWSTRTEQARNRRARGSCGIKNC